MTDLDPTDPQPPGTGMSTQVSKLAAEALRQAQDGLWELSAKDTQLARETADRLAEVIGPAAVQEQLVGIERLEHLREALAVIAIGVARTHGRLAWFLARATTALTPVLGWRSLTAEDGRYFGTRVPDPAELADAENAVRCLHTVLSHNPAPAPSPTHLWS
ncbi:hypothetical protein ACGFX4_38915 [Kitasatospora sp. NPDC048365]|uniref:hypothetical protein n=1 Tax=Kitasatospora sp. NPDC048365 TaxID=3364050 RepID=UPI003718A821